MDGDQALRDLVVQAIPRYTRATSTIGNSIDVDSFSLTLQGRYQFTRYIAGIAGYTYYLQRSSSAVTTAAGTITSTDVDQNRVYVGVQFGYPISID